jgi:hypothetical protein
MSLPFNVHISQPKHSVLSIGNFFGINLILNIVLQRLVTGWMIGVLWFHSRRWLGIFLFTTASRTTLGPTQPPIQWVPGDLSLGGGGKAAEAWSRPLPSSADVKISTAILPLPNTPSRCGAQLKQAQGELYLYISICKNVLISRLSVPLRMKFYIPNKWMYLFVAANITSGRFTPRERAPDTHCIGGWVVPRAGLDAVV